jgi:hypothetical protein
VRETKQHGRHVGQWDYRVADPTRCPPARSLREDESEVQEERRQYKHRDRIRPVEEPVETIEASAEGERENPEERDAEPEKMQRRGITRPAESDGRADEQRENADRGEEVIENTRTARNRRDPKFHDLTSAQPKDGVARGLPHFCALQHRFDVPNLLHRAAIDGNQHITTSDARS